MTQRGTAGLGAALYNVRMEGFPPGFLQELDEYIGMLKALGIGDMVEEIVLLRDRATKSRVVESAQD